MSERGAAAAEPYSPRLRTALVLAGTGTAGAYHAGVLRALHEAGVKIDVVAARGVGVVGALLAAVDGAPRLWDEKGFWRGAAVRHFYPWRQPARAAAWGVAAAATFVALPLAAVAAGLIVFPIDFVLKMLGAGAAGSLTSAYLQFADAAFAPSALPTWLPRLAVLALATAGLVALASAWKSAGARRARGSPYWRLVPAPLASAPVVDHCWRSVWDLVRGAAQLKQPAPADLGRRYIDLLTENFGQPGFRELLIVAHDVDAGRDVVFPLVPESRRRELIRRPRTGEVEARRAEVVDLAGVGRDHLADAVAAALAVPLATDYHTIAFAPDSYWRGESHRLCDRPASLARILEELDSLGVEQLILVSAVPESPGPHALSRSRLDLRERFGEYLQSSESAAFRDALRHLPAGLRVFTVRPVHNPIGPFDFRSGFDDRSDRALPLAELINRGYEDAYRQFIEPVVGASGERVGQQPIGSGREN
jgi:hypothetical protein